MNKPILETPPVGYKPIVNAMTAPKGAQWWSNGKSLFGEDFHAVLVREQKTEEK